MAWLGGRRPENTVADIDQARRLVAQLPAHDCMRALEDATRWIESIMRTDGIKPNERYALIDLIDQSTRSHQRRLAQEDRARSNRPSYSQEARRALELDFWKAVGNAYVQCIDGCAAGGWAAGAVRKDYVLIAARGLRALSLQLKLALLHYGPVEPAVWHELGRLYRGVEAKHAAETPVEVYPGGQETTTVQQEFLKAMLLGVSSMQALTVKSQEIAERTITHFGAQFTLGTVPAPHHNYCFDLEAGEPPTRRRPGLHTNGSTRYFGAARAWPALAELVESTKTRASVPSQIDLGGKFEPAVVLPVFEHLAKYWSDRPPTRRWERRRIATPLTVVVGFRALIDALFTACDNSLDFETVPDRATWIVDNVSKGGLGAVVPEAQGESVQVGSLLGLQSEGASDWSVAVVRRVSRERSGQQRVGLQLLCSGAIPVELSLSGRMLGSVATSVNDRALLLSAAPDRSGEIAVVLREGGYAGGQVLEMTVRGKLYDIAAVTLIQGGDDYDWAMYKPVRGT